MNDKTYTEGAAKSVLELTLFSTVVLLSHCWEREERVGVGQAVLCCQTGNILGTAE